MAAIARPTWNEVREMDELTLIAIGIVRGQMQGDEFIWDAEWYDEKTDMIYYGQWKSIIKKNEQKGGR